jgi:hypothetical protein
MADLKQQGSDPKPYYISFAKEDDPMSGFVDVHAALLDWLFPYA